jgi:hypothetical protein
VRIVPRPHRQMLRLAETLKVMYVMIQAIGLGNHVSAMCTVVYQIILNETISASCGETDAFTVFECATACTNSDCQ